LLRETYTIDFVTYYCETQYEKTFNRNGHYSNMKNKGMTLDLELL